ncbi:Sensor histidine kinase TmoS [Ephemeroptericola cinctiostellae]|uniref:histidine kinase n=1 Tax=Ephemeroptericola cinctiostellae TaxID=2268024 RepID=A0A345DA83_9BURK|nr:ATP-binding protein [Ephemeroptericola cinctiostellae]AXF85271.1 Sensor histidine kinase TmoS [Ephemeroptericola cinctiostellae]
MKLFFNKERGWTTLIIVLLLLLLWSVIALFQRVSSNEKEQNVITTASDLYWFDQAINTRLNHAQLQVWGLAREIDNGSLSIENFNKRSESILNDAPELTNIIWLDADGQTKVRASNVQAQLPKEPIARDLAEQNALRRAAETHETASTEPIKMTNDSYEVALIQPFYDNKNQIMGFIKAQYSLTQLFNGTVPDWFSKKYYLHAYYTENTIYSTAQDETVTFDPNLPTAERNMYISTTPILMRAQLYPDRQLWVLRGLFAGMVLLLLALLGSLIALIRDMRRRRLTEKELRTQYNLRHAIEKSLTVGIRAHALDGTMFYVNPAFCEMIGYEEEEIINIQPPLPYIPKEETEKILWIRDTLLEDPEAITVTDIKMRRKSGEVIDTIMRGGPLYDEKQSQIGWITSVEDVTERRRLEQFQADEQKRLEAVNHLINMGEMASVIAHELNQPLSAILGYTTGLSNYIKKDTGSLSGEKLIDVTEKIRRQADRAANVTRRVQQFVQQKSIAPVAIDVSNWISQTIEFMELEFKKQGGRVINHVEPKEVSPVLIDITMLQQILINLLRNALEAMVEYGSSPREVHIYAENYSLHHVLIQVIDNGPGISVDKVETIFNPFYTTKTHGVGIGLNICRTMMESNGGRLWARADLKGGVFYLTLPIAAEGIPLAD